MHTEQLVLSNLVKNEEYSRKVLPLLKEEYFKDANEKRVFNMVKDYYDKYSSFPTQEILFIELNNKVGDLNESSYKASQEIISEMEVNPNSKIEWLVDLTEKFCQKQAIDNALMEAISIKEDTSGKTSVDLIPKLLQEALSVSFDTDIGHDYLENAGDRFDYYHLKTRRIPFDIALLNETTKGGLPPKSFNVILAGIHVGKTQLMCHMAGNNLKDQRNVLYITMEMSEEEISRRIDANLLDIGLEALETMPRDKFERRINKIKETTKGRFIVKEYPTSMAGVGQFRHLLNELKLKKNFVPEVIYVDYINLVGSSRIKLNNKGGTYEYIKAVAEELRGLAVEYNVALVTATQLTRSGFTSSDVGLEDTAESFGLPATADWMIALTQSEEMVQLNQILVKQLKNRHGNLNHWNRFVIGVDRDKMRFYDVPQSASEELVDSGPAEKPVMDNTRFGEEEIERSKPKQKLMGFR